MFERYAIFYTAPAGAFADAGSAWLGWDSAAGQAVPHPDVGLELSQVTATPRRYGFHATLKAPFRPAVGLDEAALIRAVDAFAQATAPVVLDGLAVQVERGFVALRPVGDEATLRNFAGACVRNLDHLRAPLTEVDIARRRKAPLTARQDAQMLEWGYPYIFADFHFHMTLSGPLGAAQAGPVIAAAQDFFAPVLTQPFTVDAVTLLGERNGRFHQLHRATLSGSNSA
ncbi:MAG: DUF1045 domain-containing protein [Pseudomonadota bacterium]